MAQGKTNITTHSRLKKGEFVDFKARLAYNVRLNIIRSV